MIKEYKSFAEIEERLNVLKLEREIVHVSLKLNFYRALGNFHPMRLLHGSANCIKKMALSFIMKKLTNLFRR